MTTEQIYGFNINAWQFKKDRKEGWMYVKSISHKNGWLRVVFADGDNSPEERLVIRVSYAKLDIHVGDLLCMVEFGGDSWLK